MNTIYELHRDMISRKVILAYQGDFSQETVKCILALGERTLELAGEAADIRKKVFNVMVESLQNIVRHGDRDAAHPPVFLVGKESNGYSVMSGNPVLRERVPELKASLEGINQLDAAGLKDLHKQIIQGTSLSEKGGAGLGFVDMARKSGEKLSFDFPELSETFCFFCLKVNIPLQS